MKKKIYDIYLKILSKDGIPSFLNKYLSLKSINRLKNICYFCGMDYASKDIYKFKEKVTRYDHSLSVALLTWNLTKNKEMTIAALFHDIATPCFSHAIDYMNKDYETQESTEEYTEEILKSDKDLKKCLKEDNIDIKKIINFKEYSIVDNNRPKLCADRLDGIILTGALWTKTLNTKDIKKIINSTVIYENEDKELEIGFNSKSVGGKVLKTSNKIDVYCHSKEDNYMMELLGNIARLAIENKIIKYKDLFYLDEEILFDKLKKSKNKEILNLLDTFHNIKKKDIKEIDLKGVKPRILNPLVCGKRLIMEACKSPKYMRVMYATKSHAGGFEYKIDEVNETENWNPLASNPEEFGGFNFSVEDKMLRWLLRGDTLYDVIIPSDAEVVECESKSAPHGVFRSNKIILTNPRKLNDDLVMDLYLKSNLPDNSYFQCLTFLSLRDYDKVCKKIIEDRVNETNVEQAIETFTTFFELKDEDKNECYNNVYKLLNKIKKYKDTK